MTAEVVIVIKKLFIVDIVIDRDQLVVLQGNPYIKMSKTEVIALPETNNSTFKL